MAASAPASSSSRVDPCAGKLATPMLTVSGLGSSAASEATLSRRALAAVRASLSDRPGSRAQNSSPPVRNTLSPARVPRRSASETTHNAWSPTWWPLRSLICLKSSMSKSSMLKGSRVGQLSGQLLVEHPVAEQPGQ